MSVTGRLKQRTFDDKEGIRRTVVEIDAAEIAASLTYARATVTKTYRPGSSATAPRSATTDTGQAQPAAPAETHPF
ncbi:hypothetical protein [Streptomyces sp. NPDC003023]|uniref:hypothetical protein n=1 Tax=Streptomyces sp. NPDC003023 TaxID=3364675 RepID=UPI003687505B